MSFQSLKSLLSAQSKGKVTNAAPVMKLRGMPDYAVDVDHAVQNTAIEHSNSNFRKIFKHRYSSI